MQTLLDRFDKKTPHYPNRYREMIDKLARKRAFDTSSGTFLTLYVESRLPIFD